MLRARTSAGTCREIRERPGGLRAGARRLALPLLFCVISSSGFVAAKVGIRSSPPLLLASLRFVLAGVLLLGAALLRGRSWPSARSIAALAALGVLNVACYQGLTFVALASVSAALVSLIASTSPLITAVLARIALREVLQRRQVVGLGIAALGVCAVLLRRIEVRLDSVGGVALALLAVTLLACATVGFKKLETSADLSVLSGIQLTAGGLWLLPASWCLEDWSTLCPNWELWVAAGYLVLVVSGCGTVIWFHILSAGTASTASSYHFMLPVMGVLFSFLILGEQISAADLVGALPVLIGIALVTKPRTAERVFVPAARSSA